MIKIELSNVDYDETVVLNKVLKLVADKFYADIMSGLKQKKTLNDTDNYDEFKSQIINKVSKQIFNDIKENKNYEHTIEKAIFKGVNKTLGVIIQKSILDREE